MASKACSAPSGLPHDFSTENIAFQYHFVLVRKADMSKPYHSAQHMVTENRALSSASQGVFRSVQALMPLLLFLLLPLLHHHFIMSYKLPKQKAPCSHKDLRWWLVGLWFLQQERGIWKDSGKEGLISLNIPSRFGDTRTRVS